MRLKHISFTCLLLIITTSIISSSALFAQENTVITLAVPNWMLENIDSAIFDDFEAAHSGVSVSAVGSEAFFGLSPETDINAHLDTAAEYASAADMLLLTNANLTVAGTRAGYYLDLAPLVASDADLNESDFFPSMWESFQWDGGTWALPVSTTINFFVYRKDVFDAAGLDYPTENWTFNEFATAARALTQRDGDGNVTLPGYLNFGTNYLLRSWLTQGYYDPNVFPQTPLFNDSQLANLVNQWHALEAEGVIGTYTGSQSWSPFDVPFMVFQPFNLIFGEDRELYGGSLLPGGTAGLDLNGLAVSAGTPYPELAYDLAKYLTSSREFIVATNPQVAARQSLASVHSAGGTTLAPIPEEIQPLIDQAVTNALPVSEMRFSGYIEQALMNMQSDNLDATTELQNMELQAIQDLEVAQSRRDTNTVYVATAVPTPQLSPNETVLRFGIDMMVSPLPNQAEWDQFVADFIAQDAAIGDVQIGNDFNGDVALWAQQKDCFYLSFNAVASSTSSVLLSIDPFLDADANFDPNDLAPGVLSQVQRNGLTYALPMTLQPEVLWYDSTLFDQAGAIAPENGWTVDEFEDALTALHSADSTRAPFSPGSNGAGYIMMLIAAYGGMPLDAIANPPVINFTDPSNVNAIRQVLDLIRAGYITYDSLGDYNSSGIFGQFAITDDYINALSFESQFSFDGTQESALRLTTYPRGTQYTPVSYGIGSGYISSTTQNPEACYRFLSALARRPDLLAGMPVRPSLLNDSAFTATLSPDALNFYQNYFEMLQDPNIVYVPGNFGTGDQFTGLSVIQLWLYRALDAYVLEDADLETELAQAQSFAASFIECSNDLPPDNGLGATEQERIVRYNAYVDCVVLVDPSLSETFGR